MEHPVRWSTDAGRSSGAGVRPTGCGDAEVRERAVFALPPCPLNARMNGDQKRVVYETGTSLDERWSSMTGVFMDRPTRIS
jgi:hypothetical protein